MVFLRLNRRLSVTVRLVASALIVWSVFAASDWTPGTSGRSLVVTVLLAICVIAIVAWLTEPDLAVPVRADAYVLALAAGALTGASPYSAAVVFVFTAVISAGVRSGHVPAMWTAALGALGLAVTDIIWKGSATGLLAYSLGFAATGLAAANVRQFRTQAQQAQLLLAQTQRSQEEQLRAARLEESTRIAREIHDVLAHALAGLTIQLEATTVLLENGAERDQVLDRVRQAHALAREGLRETRRAVGALRGDSPAAPSPERGIAEAIETLAAGYRSTEGHPAALTLTGDRRRLTGETGLAVLRTVQEALTNVAKHAPGAEVTVLVDAGGEGTGLRARVDNGMTVSAVGAGVDSLARSGGGFGVRGMRERAEALGGTLQAGCHADGWRVALQLPDPERER